MRTLKITNIEGIYAICIDKDKNFFAIQLSELPRGVMVGDTLTVDDEEGTLSVTKAI
jgi:hypothetical protein